MLDITHLEGSPDPGGSPDKGGSPQRTAFLTVQFLRYPVSQCFPEAHSQLSEESVLQSAHPDMVTEGNTSLRPELDTASVYTDRTVLSGSFRFLPLTLRGRGDHEHRMETFS